MTTHDTYMTLKYGPMNPHKLKTIINDYIVAIYDFNPIWKQHEYKYIEEATSCIVNHIKVFCYYDPLIDQTILGLRIVGDQLKSSLEQMPTHEIEMAFNATNKTTPVIQDWFETNFNILHHNVVLILNQLEN